MFSIAYRMLGSVGEAEDVVQEALLRLHRREVEGNVLDAPEAFATTVTTRLAIDALRSARLRRERYVGTWLPEPVLDDDADPAHRLARDESVSLALLVVLERLSPLERAVFLLREVFGYDYPTIATILERSEESCRQLRSRALRHVGAGEQRYDPPTRIRNELLTGFFAAIERGDVDDLAQLLADDVVFEADGGGKAPAIRKPLTGALEVARFLVGLERLGTKIGVHLQPTSANGGPAAVALSAAGQVVGLL
jgi:RNA polymerase sigma-70 factor (ECF subfamily)